MASYTLEDLQHIRAKYSDLSETKRPEKPSGQCPYQEYKFKEAVRFPAYKVAPLQDAEIVSQFNAMTSSTFNSINEEDLHKFLRMAFSLKSPLDKKTPIFDDLYPDETKCEGFDTHIPNKTTSIPFNKEAATSATYTVVPPTVAPQDTMQVDGAESENNKALAISFICSWLTRFAVKSPSIGLNLQYTKLEETYVKLYQLSSSMFRTFKPDPIWINCLRNAFDAFPRVRNTLVLYIAYCETKYKPSPKIFNVLRFLYFQNLEFMGMHAYVSLVGIMAQIALPPAQILTWLRMSGAELAIDEAHLIMAKYDNGMIQGGATAERLWKYARTLDQGYFNRLQTSYCGILMATLAYIEIDMGISKEEGYASPLHIFAIAGNPSLLAAGKMKAEAFRDCKNAIVSLSADASIIDKMVASKVGTVINTPSSAVPMETEGSASLKKRRATDEQTLDPRAVPIPVKRAPTIPLPPSY
nr:nucleocapsid protein [Black currant nucleorhabdovirus 1]